MDPLLGRLQRALQGRYAVEQELGRGGMATVFLGRDLRLERRVAIKVFEQDGGLIAAGERFLREIRIAAQLQHPNILPVHDSGEGEGLVYYIMPYVAGGSLRERLEREGPLPVADAVRIGREVAEALDHAHRAGIVHRDIKPDNIMLADGVAVVADFGIARAIEQGGGKVTETGLAIGTPSYMSPEQAAASPQVDGRTDLYALGCVLYELLAGQPPFGGPTAQVVMARHATDQPPPLATVRTLPSGLEPAIQKALAKLPGDRWATGRAMADALTAPSVTQEEAAAAAPASRRRVAVAGGTLVLLLGAALVSPLWRAPGAAAADPLRLVAVLPFTSVGDTAYLSVADGLTEGVSTALVQVEGLGVLSGVSLEGDGGENLDAREVGRRLGADVVLVGHVRGSQNEFRVTPRLIEVSTGRALWQQHFYGQWQAEGLLKDFWQIQDSMAVQIVAALLPQLGSTRRASVARGVRTHDLEAYGLYIEALRLGDAGGRTPRNWEQAVSLLRRAIARDSTFPDAWVALHTATASYVVSSGQPPSALPPAVAGLLDRAIALDSLFGMAYSVRANYRTWWLWDLEGAREDHRKALLLSPASASVLSDYAWFLLDVEPDSALAYARRAWALDPLSPNAWQALAGAFLRTGHPDSALATGERAIALEPEGWTHYYFPARAYLMLGRRAEADSAIARYLRLGGYCCSQSLAYAAAYFRHAGDQGRAEEMLDSVTAFSRRQYVSPSEIAAVRLAVGDRAGALDALEQAMRDGDPMLADNLTFILGSLRGEPRYEAVRRRVLGDRPFPAHALP